MDNSGIGGLRVLVVDDSAAIRSRAAETLGAAGYRVAAAADGFAALALIAEERPDLILADAVMPRLDGFQLCTLVKHNPALTATPVVLLSRHDDLFERARAEGVGAGGSLAKPFSAERLLEVVDRHTRLPQ